MSSVNIRYLLPTGIWHLFSYSPSACSSCYLFAVVTQYIFVRNMYVYCMMCVLCVMCVTWCVCCVLHVLCNVCYRMNVFAVCYMMFCVLHDVCAACYMLLCVLHDVRAVCYMCVLCVTWCACCVLHVCSVCYMMRVRCCMGSVDVIAMAAGPHHVVAVGNDGEVFTWGRGANGRLGRESDDNWSVIVCNWL